MEILNIDISFMLKCHYCHIGFENTQHIIRNHTFTFELRQVSYCNFLKTEIFVNKSIWYILNPNLTRGGGGIIVTPSPSWFSLNNSETVKDASWRFAAFSNFSFETFVPSLLSLTCPNLQILGKTLTGVSSISGFLVNPL